MIIWGSQFTTGSNYSYAASYNSRRKNVVYTASGLKAVRFGVYARDRGAIQQVRCWIMRADDGVLVLSKDITIPSNSGAGYYYSDEIGANLDDGDYYLAVASIVSLDTLRTALTGGYTESTGTGVVDPWESGSDNNFDYPFFLELEDIEPTITSFNDDDFAGEYGQQSLMTVSGFDGTVNTATVAGVACTNVSDTGLTLPALVDETTVPMPTEVELEVESDEAETATANITVFPPGGFNSVILGDDLNQTATGTIFQFVPTAKEGDALFTPFVVDNKGNIIDAPAGVHSCWHLSVDDVDPNIAVARSFVVTLGSEQPTPDSFTFNTQTNVELSTFVESNTVYISGLGGGVNADVSVSNCKYSINGGEFASTPTTIKDGDSLKLEVESSGSYSTPVVGSVTVGTYSTTFTVTTKTPPSPTVTVDLTTMTAQINATGTGDITYEIETQAQHGVATVSSTGLIEYTAGETFVGRDSFVIKVTDVNGSTYIRVSVTGRGSGGAFTFGIGIGIGINII